MDLFICIFPKTIENQWDGIYQMPSRITQHQVRSRITTKCDGCMMSQVVYSLARITGVANLPTKDVVRLAGNGISSFHSSRKQLFSRSAGNRTLALEKTKLMLYHRPGHAPLFPFIAFHFFQ